MDNYSNKKFNKNKRNPQGGNRRPGYGAKPDRRPGGDTPAAAPENIVSGRNSVRELLKSGRSVDKLFVRTGDREGSITVIVAEAIRMGIPVIEVDGSKLDAMTCGARHQVVAAMAAEKQYVDLETIVNIAHERGERPLVVVCDGIEDPHNLGAVIRCAECAGAHGIVLPKRHAVGLTPVVTSASAGALEHMAVAKVQNIAAAIEKLKELGLWIFTAEAGGTPYYETDWNCGAAVVMGSEGQGVSRLVKEKSDFIDRVGREFGRRFMINEEVLKREKSILLMHEKTKNMGKA